MLDDSSVNFLRRWPMRKLLAVVGVSLLAGALVAQGGDAKKEKLEGTWAVVSGEKGGEKAPEDAFKDVKITFAGDKMSFQKGDKSQDGTIKLDPAKKPREIDITREGKTARGIYELTGNTLKLCIAFADNDRPREFKTEAGAPLFLLVLKREK
jgi:uncharacterized protein (TIGR03067 family)